MADNSNFSDSRDEKHDLSHSPATRDVFSKKTDKNDEINQPSPPSKLLDFDPPAIKALTKVNSDKPWEMRKWLKIWIMKITTFKWCLNMIVSAKMIV